jgi:sugar/nucleoside kinase (ribokinase family)
MAIVVVGSVALDSITTAAGTRTHVLGGSATYFTLAARRFAPVRLVAAIGLDMPKSALSVLTHPQVDLNGLAVLPGNTFRWEGRYSDDLASRTTTGLALGVFETFQPHIPPAARRCSTLFLANIDPSLQELVLSQVDTPRLIGVDTIDHWIRTQRDALVKLLKRIDVLFLNEEEARLLTQAGSLKAMGAWLRRQGPEIVIIKQGWYGAVGWVGPHMVWVPAYPVEHTVDPTGAGDSFAGGVLGFLDGQRRLDAEALRQGMLYGSVTGSFVVEGFGVTGLHRLSEERFARRLEMLRRIAGIPEASPRRAGKPSARAAAMA